jgi:hypothetical protein
MSPFEILQIGEDIEPTAGIPEGCELCGHCRMLRRTLPEGTPLSCGVVTPGPQIAAAPHGAREQTTRGAS